MYNKLYKAISLEPHVKSLHITLAYHFKESTYDSLKGLVDGLQLAEPASWELRLYSRDPRFAKHQVHKVTQSYAPRANDELELVLGDYIYIEEKELEESPDGWVPGTSWLTGVSGFLPAVCTQRTAESDAWTLHRAISLGNSGDCKSESGSNTELEMTSYPHEDATELAREKSEEMWNEWHKYWTAVATDKTDGILSVTQGQTIDWDTYQGNVTVARSDKEKSKKPDRRWIFTMRHGERVDLTFGHWVNHCFDDNGKYVRKDLNLPLTLGEREGGADSYMKDTPLTRVGRFQAQLVGEGLRLAGISVKHVYASAALRCVETAISFLEGLQSGSDVKVKVEPGLFEFKGWHAAKGIAPFMTPLELHKAGYNVDLSYKPYFDLDTNSSETMEEFYQRNEVVMQSAVKETEADGGNIIFVGHAATLEIMTIALQRMENKVEEPFTYKISNKLLKVPYCAFAAMKDKPYEIMSPPCPPSINSSSGRFDWRILQEE